jgi:hypothetical protein
MSFVVRPLALSTLLCTLLAATGAAQADTNQPTAAQARAAAAAGSGLQVQGKPGKPKVWAAVVSDAGLVSRGAATGASLLATGQYQVDFPVDVTACIFVGSQGTTDTGSLPDGSVTTARRAGVPTAVFVRTFDTAGLAINRSFHVAAICP